MNLQLRLRQWTRVAAWLAAACAAVLARPAGATADAPAAPATKPAVDHAAPPLGYVEPAGDVLFPASARVVNVRDFGARGDGVADDTAAIQKALDDHPAQGAVIYLPAGTYLISDTIRWPKGPRGGLEEKNTILQGQSPRSTIIRLKDRAAGFGEPQKPKAMIWTGSKPAQRFRNAVRGVTIDVGVGNGGAVGLQFNASNQGCVRDVVIRTADVGRVGLDLAYTDEIGPLLVSNVKVEGFAVGVLCGFAVNSQTFEQLTLENQSELAFRNGGQCVSIRGLTTKGPAASIENANLFGVMALVDAELSCAGGGSNAVAVTNGGSLLARNIRTSGFASAIRSAPPKTEPQTVVGPNVSEFVSHPAAGLFGGVGVTLNLPVRPTPAVPNDPPAQWAVVTDFGATPDDNSDDTDAIQKAIDSGKTTVCLPRGTLVIDGTLRVRGAVRRLVGTEATLRGKGRIIVEDGVSPVVVFERFRISYSPIEIEQATARTLVLSSAIIHTYSGSRGDCFIEDVCGGPFVFKGQNVWARQLNAEPQATKVLNDGGRLWILGLKTERGGTLVDTVGGGRSEVLGGFAYATSKPKVEPMFSVADGCMLSVTIGEACFNGNPFQVLVRQSRNSETKELKRGQTPGRQIGSAIPLFSTEMVPTKERG